MIGFALKKDEIRRDRNPAAFLARPAIFCQGICGGDRGDEKRRAGILRSLPLSWPPWVPFFPAMSFQFWVVKVTHERCTRTREASRSL
jgi:hypothetical protein